MITIERTEVRSKHRPLYEFRVVARVIVTGETRNQPPTFDLKVTGYAREDAKKAVAKYLREQGFTTGRVTFQWFGQRAI